MERATYNSLNELMEEDCCMLCHLKTGNVGLFGPDDKVGFETLFTNEPSRQVEPSIQQPHSSPYEEPSPKPTQDEALNVLQKCGQATQLKQLEVMDETILMLLDPTVSQSPLGFSSASRLHLLEVSTSKL